ncbi:globin family protein [Mastigocoleus testarum]|uniref:Uncharacterized protein n=1 Tax=Mastigocoleus testarum BC008 TaxID=371196 RepID=A0A0V7ZDA8_9CYAN|nr:hypothetical protein [Mastigocoleus testarum]KST62451.1 hypothetical protein BC008_09800 [Mastigocoleus testarum BC008]
MSPTQDPVKWTDSVTAIVGIISAIITLLTYIDGRRKGKSSETIIKETLIKGELIFINSSVSILQKTEKIAPKSESLKSINSNIVNYKKNLEDKLEALKRRFEYSQEAHNWLDKNRKSLSREAGRYALNKCPELININQDTVSKENIIKFYRQINFYLDLICGCLKFGRSNILDKSPIFQLVHLDLYLEAFAFIKEKVKTKSASNNLSKEASSQIVLYVDDLIDIIRTKTQ